MSGSVMCVLDSLRLADAADNTIMPATPLTVLIEMDQAP
jgi:hypothetical protein